MIKDHIAASASISIEDLEYTPFYERGGPVKFYSLFGEQSNRILEELCEALIA